MLQDNRIWCGKNHRVVVADDFSLGSDGHYKFSKLNDLKEAIQAEVTNALSQVANATVNFLLTNSNIFLADQAIIGSLDISAALRVTGAIRGSQFNVLNALYDANMTAITSMGFYGAPAVGLGSVGYQTVLQSSDTIKVQYKLGLYDLVTTKDLNPEAVKSFSDVGTVTANDWIQLYPDVSCYYLSFNGSVLQFDLSELYAKDPTFLNDRTKSYNFTIFVDRSNSFSLWQACAYRGLDGTTTSRECKLDNRIWPSEILVNGTITCYEVSVLPIGFTGRVTVVCTAVWLN